jgi:hypothetical protein
MASAFLPVRCVCSYSSAACFSTSGECFHTTGDLQKEAFGQPDDPPGDIQELPVKRVAVSLCPFPFPRA